MLVCWLAGCGTEIPSAIKTIYAAFKGQIGAAVLFRSRYGQARAEEIKGEWTEKIKKLTVNEEVAQMELQLLRALTCLQMVLEAVEKDN